LVILVLAAILLSPDQPVAANEFGMVTITGQSLAPFESSPLGDPSIGSPAPEVSGVGFDGTPISISNDGRPKVVLFLAHSCPHCQREVPAIERYLEENDFPDGVDFISVATASSSARPNWPPSAWLAREGWSIPTMVDDETFSALRAFGQGGFPYYVLVDRNGLVAHRMSGEQDPANLAAIMQALVDLP
jgi:thiol-disulfide isomerase/thioredoxin